MSNVKPVLSLLKKEGPFVRKDPLFSLRSAPKPSSSFEFLKDNWTTGFSHV